MTKKELQQLYWLKRNIQQLENKLIELETEATKMTRQLSKAPIRISSTDDRLSEIVCKIVEVQNEINRQLEKSYECTAKIEKAIETLPPREAYLIRMRYLELKRWEEICVEMNYSWRQIHYIHAEALKMLA